MGAPKKPPGRIMRAAIRVVLGPKGGRRNLTDEEIREAAEKVAEEQERQDRDGGDRR